MSSLTKVTVDDVVSAKRTLVDVDSGTSVMEAFAVLRRHRLRSLPVYGRPGSWIGSGGVDLVVGNKQYIGIVSLLDIVCFLLKQASASDDIVDRDLLQRTLQRPICDAIGSTNESLSLWIEPPDRPLLFAMEQLSKGVHRALVPQGDVCRILSQTDVARYLSRHLGASKALDSTLLQLNLGHNKPNGVVAIEMSMSLPRALQRMTSAGVSALPIVDDDGVIVATLSASDFRGVHETALLAWHGLTALQFVQETHGVAVPAVVVATVNHSLRTVLDAMLIGHIHRCWIQDGDDIGVVSLTDVIAAVYREQRGL